MRCGLLDCVEAVELYYYDFINYDVDWLEPRLMIHVDDKELLSHIFQSYPCHININ